MKVFAIIPLFCFFSVALSAQQYALQSTKVLAQNGNYSYQEGHFEKGLRFVEFLLNTHITDAEKQTGLQESISGFQQDPVATLQEVETMDQHMQRVYKLTDPTQIALFRTAMLSQLAVVFQQSNETFVLRQLIEKYNPILAYDAQNMLAFTYKDFNGYMEMMAFQARLYGQTWTVDAQAYAQYQQYLVQQFLQGTVELRRSLALMEIVNEYTQATYNKLTPVQQQQYQLALMAQAQPNNNSGGYSNSYSNTSPNTGQKDYTLPEWPAGVTTTAQKRAYLAKRKAEIASNNYLYNTMSNMMTEQHVTSMNIIENMGGSGNYWEIKYD